MLVLGIVIPLEMINRLLLCSISSWHLIALAAVAFCCAPVIHAEAASIDSVTFSGSAADPTVTIYGSGFGSEPVATSQADYPYTGLDYGTNLHITDRSNVPMFDAGYDDPSHGAHDLLGLIVTSYSENLISYTFGSNYGITAALYSILQLNQRDTFTAYAAGASFDGTVDYAPEPGSLGLSSIALAVLLAFYRYRRPATYL